MRWSLLAFSLSLLWVVGCGSNVSAGDGAAVPCKDETFTLDGSLDEQPLQLVLPLGGFGFQTTAGAADVHFGTGGALHLSYSSPLVLDEPTDASGTLTLPSEAPSHVGEKLAVGQGSSLTHADASGLHEAMTFRLESFANGTTPLSGSLHACFAHTFAQGP